jgi:zinc transport system substrate-binding protein
MKKILILFFAILYPSIIFAKLTIITSINPVYILVRDIVADSAEVYSVIPVNANPHTFEPSPKIVKKIKKGDIFIEINKDFDGWIEKFLPENCKVIHLLDKRGVNPHIWLSPKIMANKINLILKHLSKFDQENINKYMSNGKDLKNKILQLTKSFNFRIKAIEAHPAWNYFAKDFDIKIVGTLSEHGLDISPKHYLKLIEIAKIEKVKYLLVGIGFKNSIVESLADKINGNIIYLNPIGNPSMNYYEFLLNNLMKIKQVTDNSKN